MTIAVIVFILILTMIGFLLSSSNKNASFPPEIAHCPDYYNATFPDDNNIKCTLQQSISCQDLGFPDTQCLNLFEYNKNATPLDKCNKIKNGIDYISWPGISDRDLC